METNERGSWDGSTVTAADIDRLRHSRKIPLEIICRLPGDEIAPKPQSGEYVVFTSHFDRGFGLPISIFFRQFLDRFEIQPHHLPANAIVVISAFVTFCEAYLGLLPTPTIFSKFFYLRPNVLPDRDIPAGQKPLTQCGSAMVSPRRGSIFPRILGLESCKNWHRTYFYVKNPSGGKDYINLPRFRIGAPTQRTHWNYDPKEFNTEAVRVAEAVQKLKDEGMTADDLLATFIYRRVCPLQHRPHKMCFMSGRHDPCRTTTFELSKLEVYRRIKAISKTDLKDGKWEWGRSPHDREDRAPNVSPRYHFQHTYLSYAGILLF